MNAPDFELPGGAARRIRRVALFVAGAALLVHLGLFAGGVWSFDALNYDDPQVLAIAENAGVVEVFTELQWYAYKPIYFLSLKIDTLFGSGVASAHVQNLVWHALATFLLVLVLYGLLRRPWIAGAAGLLFAVHPVHVESVAWISGRKDVLSLVFVLLAHLAYRRARDRGRFPWAAPLWLLLGGWTKGTVWVWPALLLLDEWIEAGRRSGGFEWRGVAARLAPCALVGVGGVVADGWIALSSGPGAVEHATSTGGLAASMAGVHLGYVQHALAPVGLALDYAVDPAGSWGSPLAWGGLLLLLGAFVLLWVSLRRRFVIGAVGAGIWLVGLSPVNNLWPRTTTLMADRYLYVPAIGAYVLLAALAARHRAGRISLGVATVLLAVLCLSRTAVFRDSETVWADTVAKVPESALAWVQRGQAAAARGAWEAAETHAAKAIDLEPRPEIRVKALLLRTGALLGGIGNAASRGTKPTEAELRDLLTQAGETSRYALSLPTLPGVRQEAAEVQAEAEVLRGQALELWRDPVSALSAYESAVRLWPSNAEAHHNFGTLLAEAGELGQAEHELETALRLRPNFLEAALQLGTVIGMRGRVNDAIAVLDRAAERHGRLPEVLFTQARVHLSAGRDVAKAEVLLRELQRDAPEHPRASRLLGDIHLAHARLLLEAGREERDRGKLRDALERYEAASKAHRGRWEAYVGAGDTHLELGNYRDARDRYRRGAEIAHGLPWVAHLVARAAMLESAWRSRHAATDTDRREAARVSAQGLQEDSFVIDLGLLALNEELEWFRKVASSFDASTPVDQATSRVLRAVALAVTGDEPGARNELRAALTARGPEEAQPDVRDAAILLRALLRERAGDIEEAGRDYAILVERHPEEPVPRLRQLQLVLLEARARLKVAAGDPEATARGLAAVDERAMAVRTFADEHPDCISAEMLAVEAEMHLRQWVPALRRLNSMVERHPPRATIYRGQSAVYVSQYLATRERRLLGQAARVLRIAMTLDPRDPRVLLDAAHVARIAGDLPRALQHGERARAVELVPGGPAARLLCDLHVAIGGQALEKGDAPRALAAVEAALAANRGAGAPWTLKGDVLLRGKKYDAAFDAYRTALELEPASQKARSGMARVHRERALIYRLAGARLRAPEEATEAEAARIQRERAAWRKRELRELEAAIRLDPAADGADGFRERVEDLRDLDPAAQRAAYEQANADVRAGRIDLAAGRLVDAFAAFERAIDGFPNHLPAHVLIAGTAYDLMRVPGEGGAEEEQRLEARYLNLAFHSLQAADTLDARNLFPDRHRFRGLLDELLYRRTREVAFRVAAERAYEAYLSAKRAAGVEDDAPASREIVRRLRTLRSVGADGDD